MTFRKTLLLTTMVSTVLSAPAFANGYNPAPAPQHVVVAPAAFDWSGWYFGGHLGGAVGQYTNNGNVANFPGDLDGDLDGFFLGMHGGYAVQSGNMVYGAEAHLAFADISGAEACTNPAAQCAVDINALASLRGNVGYLINPDTLISANLGLAAANANVFVDDGTGPIGSEDIITGLTYGIGIEHALNPNLSLRGSIQSYQFQPNDFQTDILYTGVDIDFHTIEIGLNYRF